MAADERVRRWAAEKMGGLLQMPPDSCAPIVENILVYDNPLELKGFLSEFMDKSAEHKVNAFVEELFAMRGGGGGAPAAAPPQGRGPPQGGREADGRGGGRGRGKGGDADAGGRGKGRGRRGDGGGEAAKEKDHFPTLQMPMYERPANDRRRIVVDAASGRYNVLTNCLNCGKVVVEEEGWGPCLFCGNPLEVGDRFGVKHGDDRGFLDAGTQNAQDQTYNESFERAKATKDRLLSYDRDAKKRTKVFDDATDWYSEAVNPWLNEKQREDAMRNASEEERRKREEKRRIHATIDIFGRTVISADAEVAEQENLKNKAKFQTWTENVSDQNRLLSMMQEESRGLGGKASHMSGESQQLYDKLRASLHASGRDSGFQPKAEAAEEKKNTRWDASNDNKRVENDFSGVSVSDFAKASNKAPTALLPEEESPYGDADDGGMCLSMHQPQASLLVHGFKRAEGRNWKTEHRGRLWIHAASKSPEEGDIELYEQTYRSIYEAQGVPMPPLPSETTGYPTSVLLGCVDVEECWANEEYKKVLSSSPSMPQEDNDSAHIFWCLRPRRLAVPLKMPGDNKIWRLPKMSLSAAQRGLQPVRWPAPTQDGQAMMSSPHLPAAEARRTAAAARAAAGAAAASSSATAPAAKAAPAAPPQAAQPAAAAASGARPPRPAVLDLWPAERPSEVLEMVERDREGSDRDAMVLQNGFVHLAGFIPTDIQQRIIDTIRDLGVSSAGFFPEHFDGVKVSSGVTRMYLGSHWNSQSQVWEQVRNNLDGEPVADLPKLFKDMYDEAIKRANREISRGPNKKRKLVPLPEGKLPNVGVANFYEPNGSMQMHQDKTESKASVDAGYAVMGICLGDACEFAYGSEAPSAGKKPKTFRLESGDVYLFGGESRMLWHAVTRILPRTSPPSLRLLPGRLSVTLRVK